MHPIQPKHVRFVSGDSQHPLVFAGERGEHLQVSVLDQDLIRVQHFPEGHSRLDRTWMVLGKDGDVPREGRRRDDLSPFPCPAFSVAIAAENVQIRTRQLTLEIALGDFWIRWFDAAGNGFASDLSGRAYTYDRAGRAIYHYLERRIGEHYYGFGERSGELDKAGRRMRMHNLDSLAYNAATTDPLYKHIPFYITFLPELQIAYGLFYDNLATTTFDMGKEIDAYHGRYRYYQAEDGDLDYYLLYGPTIPEVVEKFTALTGRMVLPPRWALGFMGTTMTYFDAPDAQEQLKKFIALRDEHRIPYDLFHLASGYTLDENNKRNVFTWDRGRFPDPQAMVNDFAQAGMRIAPNIKPALLTTHPRYGEVAGFDGFVKSSEVDSPEISMFWGGPASYLDFTNPQAFDWWKRNAREQLLEYGIAALWNDNNEYEVWDDDARCHGFGDTLRIGLARPLQSLLMARASYEAEQEFRPAERAYVITRSGCPGIQRYAHTWSGDNTSTWQTLKYNITMGLGLGLSGMPGTGHDVGGFAGLAPSPELLARWVQNASVHPRCSMNSWHDDGSVNEPWMHPEVLAIVREWIEFRYRLIPYLYSLFFEAAQTGHPIVRPLVYEFPRDARCHVESFDFMLGPNLLVASVFEPGARIRRVYLPESSEWYDFYSGVCYRGGQDIEVAAPLERMPLLVRAGGIIPMGKPMKYFGAEPDDVRQAYVFPHPVQGRGTFTLYEDDGVSTGYQRGEVAKVELQATSGPESVSLNVQVSGNYRLPYRQIEFILPSTEQRQVLPRENVSTDTQGRTHVVIPL